MRRFLCLLAAILLWAASVGTAEEEAPAAEFYSEALQYFTDFDFVSAESAFRELNGYGDSDRYIGYIGQIRSKDYSCAAAAIKSLYPDLLYSEQFAAYFAAMELLNGRQYDEAEEIFGSLNGFYDTADKLQIIEVQKVKAIYNEARALMDAGEWDKAMDIYILQDDREMMKECVYRHANSLRLSGELEAAAQLYNTIPDYRDVRELITRMGFLLENCEDYFSGAKVTFGRYPGRENAEPIEWIVLEVNGNNALIISDRVIDTQVFMKKTRESIPPEGSLPINKNTVATWQHSYLRIWLNEEFYNTAFSETEQKMILETVVSADSNPKYLLFPGNETTDRVFILSLGELEDYLGSDSSTRKARPTPHASEVCNVTVNGDGYAYYWTRNSGNVKDHAAIVYGNGTFNYEGRPIDDIHIGVRPAMWVSIY